MDVISKKLKKTRNQRQEWDKVMEKQRKKKKQKIPLIASDSE